uniref:G4-like protein n=1 Tax=Meleagris gallopavo TaxID=9103 RepID=E3T0B6_MELGA|nr:G4-like protein [Meleagris gallopavo]
MWRWARGAPWGRGPPWGRGDPPEDSAEPLEICLALSRRLFDLGALCCLGAARTALRALGAGRLLAAVGLGGAAGAWLQGLAAFLLAAAALRLLLQHLLLPLGAAYAAVQGLVLAASLRHPRRGEPDGRDPPESQREPGEDNGNNDDNDVGRWEGVKEQGFPPPWNCESPHGASGFSPPSHGALRPPPTEPWDSPTPVEP